MSFRRRRSLLSLLARAAAAAAFLFVLSGVAAAEPQPWLKTAEERYARYRRTLDPADLAASEGTIAKGLTALPGVRSKLKGIEGLTCTGC